MKRRHAKMARANHRQVIRAWLREAEHRIRQEMQSQGCSLLFGWKLSARGIR